MSSVEAFLQNKLTSTSSLSSVVGGHVYAVKLAENVPFPAISFQNIGTKQEESTQGSAGLAGTLMQIDFWAKDIATARSLAESARVALEGYSGTYIDVIIGGVTEWDAHELYEDETFIFHVSATCRIWHSVTIP